MHDVYGKWKRALALFILIVSIFGPAVVGLGHGRLRGSMKSVEVGQDTYISRRPLLSGLLAQGARVPLAGSPRLPAPPHRAQSGPAPLPQPDDDTGAVQPGEHPLGHPARGAARRGGRLRQADRLAAGAEQRGLSFSWRSFIRISASLSSAQSSVK
jgi:hypothetical protein